VQLAIATTFLRREFRVRLGDQSRDQVATAGQAEATV
jgi:hypothetical protein